MTNPKPSLELEKILDNLFEYAIELGQDEVLLRQLENDEAYRKRFKTRVIRVHANTITALHDAEIEYAIGPNIRVMSHSNNDFIDGMNNQKEVSRQRWQDRKVNGTS